MELELFALVAGSVVIGAAVGITLEQHFSAERRRAWSASRRSSQPNRDWGDIKKKLGVERAGRPDAADQLRIVLGATFTVQPLLNKSEARLFRELDRLVIDCNPTWQVMAQVSMGEILRSRDARAYSCINSKRVDLLLVDGDCQPRHAIEYQGSGHYQSAAAARDAVKKEALRRAGVGYHEIPAGQIKPSELKAMVEKLVDQLESVRPAV